MIQTPRSKDRFQVFTFWIPRNWQLLLKFIFLRSLDFTFWIPQDWQPSHWHRERRQKRSVAPRGLQALRKFPFSHLQGILIWALRKFKLPRLQDIMIWAFRKFQFSDIIISWVPPGASHANPCRPRARSRRGISPLCTPAHLISPLCSPANFLIFHPCIHLQT